MGDPNMSTDSTQIQALIATAPAPIGVYPKTIELEPREYTIDETIRIDKRVYIRGNNTAIKVSAPDVTAFDVAQAATGTRFENIYFIGYSGGSLFPERGGIGLDIGAGRAIVDHCWFDSWRVALLFNSVSSGVGGARNADGFMVRDCDFTNSIYGLQTSGVDAQVGTVMNCTFTNCRKAITEQSFFGNHYISIYVDNCPNIENHDPKAAEGYGILVVSEGPEAQPSNASTFTGVWLETGTKASIGRNCTVVGANMPHFVRQGERIGLGVSALCFKGGCNNPNDLLWIGGDPPSVMRAAPNGAIAFLQRDGDVYSYKAFSYCSADPSKPDAECATSDEQGWKLRDGSTTYPCKD
jgi:hypothetical protein